MLGNTFSKNVIYQNHNHKTPIAETRFEPRRFAAVETSETQGIRHVRMQRFGRNCDNGARKCPMPAARAAAAKQHEHHADGRAASPKSTPQPPHG